MEAAGFGSLRAAAVVALPSNLAEGFNKRSWI